MVAAEPWKRRLAKWASSEVSAQCIDLRTVLCRRDTDQYVGLANAPELSATSHLSAESLDSLAGSAASRVSQAGPAASVRAPPCIPINLLSRITVQACPSLACKRLCKGRAQFEE